MGGSVGGVGFIVISVVGKIVIRKSESWLYIARVREKGVCKLLFVNVCRLNARAFPSLKRAGL